MGGIDADTLNSLAAKIDGLELTDEERALFNRLVEQAAGYEPEVEGFGLTTTSYTGLTSGADLSPTAFKLGSALRLVGTSTSMMEFEARGGWPPPP